MSCTHTLYYTKTMITRTERMSKQMVLSQTSYFLFFFFNIRASESPSNLATSGLAKVGARAALSFAFLKRAWRSGEDSDLCTDVLQEALGILQEMPVALLFDTEAVSEVWIDVVDRAMKFLTDVCRG